MSKHDKKAEKITIKINNNSSTGAQAPTSPHANHNYVELVVKVIAALLIHFVK